MIHTNIELAENYDMESLTDLENLADVENLGLEDLFTLSGDRVDKASEEYLNNFVRAAELIELADLSLPNSQAILRNTFARYENYPLIEVERNAFYPSNSVPDWFLMKRSPFMFKDVLLTPNGDFVLFFESERSSAFKNISNGSQFGVINEGSYFVSKREYKGMVMHSELFYVPLVS